jgi:uracil phosphoribosyltransferase
MQPLAKHTHQSNTAHHNCLVLDHPILRHNLTRLRDKATGPGEFRQVLTDLSRFMAYDLMRDLRTRESTVATPLETTLGDVLDEKVAVISIMRAGNGMLEGFLQAIPSARAGHIGIYRDKSIGSTVEYYLRLPDRIEGQRAIMLDPLLATGSTAVAATSRLKEFGVSSIDFVCVLAAPEGLSKMQHHHPDVRVVTLSLERALDEHGYILPGIGDAGDRLYATTA